MTMEQHLDNVFHNAAKDYEKATRGKLFEYKFYSNNIMSPELIAKGRGYIVSCNYSRSVDCNIYTIEDADTGERYTGNQFRFYLN